MESFEEQVAWKWSELSRLCDAIYDKYSSNGAMKFELPEFPVVYSVYVPPHYQTFDGYPARIDLRVFKKESKSSKRADTKLPALYTKKGHRNVEFDFNVLTLGEVLGKNDAEILKKIEPFILNGKFKQELKLNFYITSTHKHEKGRIRKLAEVAKEFDVKPPRVKHGVNPKTDKEYTKGKFQISLGPLSL